MVTSGMTYVDGVGTRHLLADHQTDGDQGSFPVAGNGPHLPHQVLELCIANETTLVLELHLNLREFTGDIGMAGG